ncbi:MAG: hypothetical protein Q8L73_10675 [Methylotenera sp.]|nr:hypothetical protein [Methylotenera sp.]
MKYFLALVFLLSSTMVYADDLAKIAGKYNYEKYELTLSNGKTLSMSDIGAKNINIKVRKDSSIFMKMEMLDGKTIETNAVINKIEINRNKGYWIAKWPDMNYPVRKDFSLHDDLLEYQIKFDNENDPMRYGATEHAILRKVNAF